MESITLDFQVCFSRICPFQMALTQIPSYINNYSLMAMWKLLNFSVFVHLEKEKKIKLQSFLQKRYLFQKVTKLSHLH
jgi:hypothetical protein